MRLASFFTPEALPFARVEVTADGTARAAVGGEGLQAAGGEAAQAAKLEQPAARRAARSLGKPELPNSTGASGAPGVRQTHLQVAAARRGSSSTDSLEGLRLRCAFPEHREARRPVPGRDGGCENSAASAANSGRGLLPSSKEIGAPVRAGM